MDMNGLRSACPLAVWLCLALLLVAVSQPVLGLFFLFLIPVWFFFSEVITTSLPRIQKTLRALPVPELLVFSPRPPPIR
jgi:hypothetical protein